MSDPTEKIDEIAKLFGLSTENDLFAEAVTHPSYAHEFPQAAHNQRLEFLGDAILDFVVSDALFRKFADAAEGKLTRTRSQVVSTEALAQFARHHGLCAALRFGKGASQGKLHDNDNVLADVVEALIAASFLHGGIDLARVVCMQVMDFGLAALQVAGARDAKSELQEKVQALGMKAPQYRVVSIAGPAHETKFEVSVSVRDRELTRGIGRSKRGAEREAAEKALSEGAYRALVATPVDGQS